ncbi:hypothetical protein HPP92_008771 [Vanilla planifolia]|uniref:Uncharacterized protein n=1 Tax=Vanilla planifolia TaxID=51239 RepID=A0A835RCK4_VANPL|nr:hypothetical protein HPP92_008771 [Vanilla planifolia]
MEASPQSFLGVHTRARTLALRQLQKPSSLSDDSMSYLQLRSRRLEKLGSPATRPNEVCKVNMRSRPDPNPISSASVSTGTVSRTRTDKLPAYPGKPNPGKVALPSLPSSGSAEMANLGMQLPNDAGFEVEVSFGDNVLEAEELNSGFRNARFFNQTFKLNYHQWENSQFGAPQHPYHKGYRGLLCCSRAITT